jgi:hypothetical protein
MITDQLPSFNQVATGTEATLDLDLGNLYREIWIKADVAAGNKTAAEIMTDIRLVVNGNDQRQHTPDQLDVINTLHDPDQSIKTSGSVGGGDLVSYIPLFLAETFRKNVERGLALGWNAVGIRSLQLKVRVAAGLTTPRLSSWGTWDNADLSRGLGPITKWKRQDLDAVGTPKDFPKVFDMGGDKDNFLQSVHIFATSTGTSRYATEIELKFNDRILFKRTAEQNQSVLASKNMSPDLSALPRFDLVFDESDAIGDLVNLRLVNKQNTKITFDSAPNGNLPIISLETGVVQ